jgi:hypothetical protein
MRGMHDESLPFASFFVPQVGNLPAEGSELLEQRYEYSARLCTVLGYEIKV